MTIIDIHHFTSLSGLVWIETSRGKGIESFCVRISPAFRGWYGLKHHK